MKSSSVLVGVICVYRCKMIEGKRYNTLEFPKKTILTDKDNLELIDIDNRHKKILVRKL